MIVTLFFRLNIVTEYQEFGISPQIVLTVSFSRYTVPAMTTVCFQRNDI